MIKGNFIWIFFWLHAQRAALRVAGCACSQHGEFNASKMRKTELA